MEKYRLLLEWKNNSEYIILKNKIKKYEEERKTMEEDIKNQIRKDLFLIRLM